MKEKQQTLKKGSCLRAQGESCGRCSVLNLAQTRIGEEGIIEPDLMEQIAVRLQTERCPVGLQMEQGLLNPANLEQKRPRQNLW
jgi:hypothetical protein